MAEHGVASMSYWNFTDIFEEKWPADASRFTAGFRLLNFAGIKKPAYFAYQFLNRLGQTELAKFRTRLRGVCRDEKGGTQILFMGFDTAPPMRRLPTKTFFRKIAAATIQRQREK